MAKLDDLIELMVQHNGERAVLVSDRPSQIFVSGQKMESSVLSADQLREALEEATPEDLRPLLTDGGSFHFRYNSPFGAYEVGAATILDTIQITLSLSKPEPMTAPLEPAPAQPVLLTTPLEPAPAQPEPLTTPLEPAPTQPVLLTTPLEPAPTQPIPLIPQHPTTVVPPSVQVPASIAPQQMFCQSCGAPNALGASFCTNCGRPLNQPVLVTGVAGGVVAPQQPQNVVNVSVQQNSSNSGWWAALMVALFATPLGCIAIPALLVILWLMFATGVVFAPTLLAIGGSVIVWKLQAVKPEQKRPIITGLLVVGGIMQVLLLSGGMHR